MTNQNTNKNENNHPDTIQNKFEISSINKIDLEYIPRLYGMSLEQYKEGVEIHYKCFNQMEKVKRIVH